MSLRESIEGQDALVVEQDKTKLKGSEPKAQGKERETDYQSRDIFNDIPVDILFEIFGWLRPVDLLYMSRTSKHLRAFLMSRLHAEWIWKAERSNIPGLPECPEDLSEPQYAALCFMKECSFCQQSKNGIYWKFRARACRICFKQRFQNVDSKSNIPQLMIKDDFGMVYYCTQTARLWEEQYKNAGDKEKWMENKTVEIIAIESHFIACEAWAKSVETQAKETESKIADERLNMIIDQVKKGGW